MGACGCRDKQGAQTKLTDLERRAQRVRLKVLTPAEDAYADHEACPLSEQLDDYLDHLKAKGATAKHVSEVGRRIRQVAADCGFARLTDLKVNSVERWLNRQEAAKVGARTRNAVRSALVAFGNWAVSAERCAVNPFAKLPRANERADVRRQRRAMTQEELSRLLKVARWRPLADYGRATLAKPKEECRGRATWRREELTIETIDRAVAAARERLAGNPEFIAECEQTGRGRALVYKTLLLTGLRKGELASLTVGSLRLDEASTPMLELAAADEKNGQGSLIPLPRDLADELRAWVADRREAGRSPNVLSIGAAPAIDGEPLFRVPNGLIKILNRDLAAAGIPKRDERGRTLDVHALRHTFGTMLSKAGVAPRTAQAAMRHSTLHLTMNVYTDPKILDVAGASLPTLSLSNSSEIARATGTACPDRPLAPLLAPTTVSDRQKMVIARQHRSGRRFNPFGCEIRHKINAWQ